MSETVDPTPENDVNNLSRIRALMAAENLSFMEASTAIQITELRYISDAIENAT